MRQGFQIYFTSDIHGHIFPVNYATNAPEASGLLNMAAQIQKDGNTLVLDGGDSLQGTPLIGYYLQHKDQWPIHPVAAGFNALGLDYFTLGNHDFNFGYEVLLDYLTAVNATCVCANLEDLRGELPVHPWKVHTLENGLRVGITGVVTDFVNVWEQPANLEHLRVTDAFTAAEKAYQALKPQCDVCICIYHGGFEEDLETGRVLSDSKENIACKLARELGFDLLVTGHQHMPVAGVDISGTYAGQTPANAAQFLHVTAEIEGSSTHFEGKLVPVGNKHLPEPYQSLLALEQAVQVFLGQPIGKLEETIQPEEKLEAALHGSRLAALFNQVQLEQTGADFSCTSLGNNPVGLASDVTIRGVSAAYLFPNTLVVLEVTEAVLRQALERCAAYFTLVDGKPEISQEFLQPKVEHYNYDFFAGLSYTFDLRRPVGDRVVALTLADGSPLGDKTYRLCTNNYRSTGTGGYEFFRSCPILWTGQDEIPELVIRYIQSQKVVSIPENGQIQVIW